jgi:hypothetical protein
MPAKSLRSLLSLQPVISATGEAAWAFLDLSQRSAEELAVVPETPPPKIRFETACPLGKSLANAIDVDAPSAFRSRRYVTPDVEEISDNEPPKRRRINISQTDPIVVDDEPERRMEGPSPVVLPINAPELEPGPIVLSGNTDAPAHLEPRNQPQEPVNHIDTLEQQLVRELEEEEAAEQQAAQVDKAAEVTVATGGKVERQGVNTVTGRESVNDRPRVQREAFEVIAEIEANSAVSSAMDVSKFQPIDSQEEAGEDLGVVSSDIAYGSADDNLVCISAHAEEDGARSGPGELSPSSDTPMFSDDSDGGMSLEATPSDEKKHAQALHNDCPQVHFESESELDIHDVDKAGETTMSRAAHRQAALHRAKARMQQETSAYLAGHQAYKQRSREAAENSWRIRAAYRDPNRGRRSPDITPTYRPPWALDNGGTFRIFDPHHRKLTPIKSSLKASRVLNGGSSPAIDHNSAEAMAESDRLVKELQIQAALKRQGVERRAREKEQEEEQTKANNNELKQLFAAGSRRPPVRRRSYQSGRSVVSIGDFVATEAQLALMPDEVSDPDYGPEHQSNSPRDNVLPLRGTSEFKSADRLSQTRPTVNAEPSSDVEGYWEDRAKDRVRADGDRYSHAAYMAKIGRNFSEDMQREDVSHPSVNKVTAEEPAEILSGSGGVQPPAAKPVKAAQANHGKVKRTSKHKKRKRSATFEQTTKHRRLKKLHDRPLLEVVKDPRVRVKVTGPKGGILSLGEVIARFAQDGTAAFQ